jgi:hypothetical protein
MTIRKTYKSKNNMVIVVGLFKENARPLRPSFPPGLYAPTPSGFFLYRDFWFRPGKDEVRISLNRTPLGTRDPWTKLVLAIQRGEIME